MSGVTAQTWESLIVDSAVVYLNYGLAGEKILGATNGGVTFGWEEFNVRTPEIDGLKGRLAGVSRITRASPQITVNLVEWNEDAILTSFPGTESAVVGENTVITRTARVIPLADYPDNIAMVGTLSNGNPIIIMLMLPMVVSGAEIPTADQSESTAALTFVGHYDPADPELEPWSITYPTESSTPTLQPLRIPAGTELVEDAVDTTVVAAISGLTAGSTRTSLDARFTVTGDNLVRTASGVLVPGALDIILVEDLAGALGSPRASEVSLTITAA